MIESSTMPYSEAIKYLFDLQWFGAKLGLENTFKLAALAGNPQDKLRFIHVAGTNGKGSTCAMLESIYREAGLRVGLFTSPHLVSFSERIQVNRQQICPSDVARLVEKLRKMLGGFGTSNHPTFFEAVTVMALIYFAEQNCDVVIWETGLGGRLDATNIVTPLASVITNVQFDHQKWLGEELPQIAREKAGIIKKNIPVITGAQEQSALEVISQTAREHNSSLTVIRQTDVEALRDWELSLLGEHQRINAAVARATVRCIGRQIPVSDSAIRAGLRHVDWPGRLQVVQTERGQTVVLDGAHNPAGAETLVNGLRKHFGSQKAALILGVMKDKDWPAICRILAPVASKIWLTVVGSPRTADPRGLLETCRHFNPTAELAVCADLKAAYAATAGEKLVVITGSLHFVGEAIELLRLAPPSVERGLNEWTGSNLHQNQGTESTR